ncbi:hypothetical protein SAY87_008677 [Trapa incisa]|uniref:CCT domain-containing protein n=1 Tax=Trapa incisa TaxID=236973 RepID=A0AAN7JU18_9MYRT|nr:hypothetical protein SAY87_008677 [Trapa incisa]
MSPCLRGYVFELGVMKASSTSTTRTSNNSSSSTLSESSNSPFFTCTRKPRTKRKRPNQKYNEAAALLSTAYPDIFSCPSQGLSRPLKFSSNGINSNFFDESSDLLLPFRAIDKSEFLLHHDEPVVPESVHGRPSFRTEPYSLPLSERPCQSPEEAEIQSNPMELFSCDYQEEFDADSNILDEEEMEEGIINAIMEGHTSAVDTATGINNEPYSIGIAAAGFDRKIGSGFGFGRSMAVNNALRNVRGANNWWDFPFPTVDVLEITPKDSRSPMRDSAEKEKKKKIKKTKKKKDAEKPSKPKEVTNKVGPPDTTKPPKPEPKIELFLKLNYEGILSAWSGQGSPFSDEGASSDAQGTDVSTRLAQINLFPGAGGVREARVQRYKEKRRTRLFSKKIRYEVRKVNVDQRPRMKVCTYTSYGGRRPSLPFPQTSNVPFINQQQTLQKRNYQRKGSILGASLMRLC